jgi:hypothetical protein
MTDAKTHPTHAAAPAPPESTGPMGHESSEQRLGPVVRFGIALTLLSLAAFASMYWMFFREVDESRSKDAPLPPLAEERMVPPDPRLQSMSGVPLVGETMQDGLVPFSSSSFADFERKQNETLSSYGWVDRQAGIVHIPIDRAIELVLKKGLPSKPSKPENR